jgi:hypothetical protein
VLVMYGFAALFALIGLGVHFNRDGESALLFFLSLVVAAVLLRQVGYLVLPQGVGSELASAAAIRERNQLIRAALPGLGEHLQAASGLDALARAIAEVAFAAGATTVTVRIDGGEPARTWAWSPAAHDADVVCQSFPVRTTAGEVLGSLDVAWTAPTYHPSSAPVVEAAAVRLVDAWQVGRAPADLMRAEPEVG